MSELTDKQLEALKLYGEKGGNFAHVANELGISRDSVKGRILNAVAKLAAESPQDAYEKAVHLGYIE